MPTSLDLLTEDEIARRLAGAIEDPPDAPYPSDFLSDAPRPAAVLIPLLLDSGRWHVLFTRRLDSLPEHSGQVAFPGGRADPGDPNPEYTALREAREEIGLEPSDVTVLGQLKVFYTITNYRVTPVVGSIPWPYSLRLAREEVSRSFTIPLDWLADPGNYQVQQRQLPSSHYSINVIYFNTYDGEILWGASARFLLNLIEILTGEKRLPNP
jgi:8-oxo-dGTP pyrophosphatase MutT (NUDIX family)